MALTLYIPMTRFATVRQPSVFSPTVLTLRSHNFWVENYKNNIGNNPTNNQLFTWSSANQQSDKNSVENYKKYQANSFLPTWFETWDPTIILLLVQHHHPHPLSTGVWQKLIT